MSSPSPLPPLASSAELWAARIAGQANLPDERLNTRLALILAALAANPADSIPQASGHWSQAKAMYRFFANERIGPDDLLQPVADATSEALGGLPTVLAVQDTTSLNFSTLTTKAPVGSWDALFPIFAETFRLSVEHYGMPKGDLRDGPLRKYRRNPDGTETLISETCGPNPLRHV